MNSQPHNASDTADTPKANGAIATASLYSDKKPPAKRQCVAPAAPSSRKQLVVTESSSPPSSTSKPPPVTTADDVIMSSLSLELLLAIALCLGDAKDIARLEQTDHRWRRVLRSNEELWRNICAHRWKKYPHYKALALDEAAWSRNHPRWGIDGTPPDLQAASDGSSCKWKKRYQWVEGDKQRTEFHSTAELESLSWSWVKPPNHRVERCQFRDGILLCPPSLTYPVAFICIGIWVAPIDQEVYQRLWNSSCLEDVDGILPGRQGLHISTQLIVARVESSGEWIVARGGDRCMFASCDDGGILEYENSVFQRRDEARLRSERILEES